MVALDDNIVVVKLNMYILAVTCQETNCVQSHLKLGTGANERAANWLDVTLPVKLDCNQLVFTLLFTGCVPLLS